jgi:hypothetical protein
MADSAEIREQQYREMDRYFSSLIENADKVRAQYWSRLDSSSPQAYDKSADFYRDAWTRYLGVPSPAGPLNARLEVVEKFPDYTASRVWLDLVPGVHAYGILLVPNNAPRPRPALVCLHGHAGNPEQVAGFLTGKELEADIYRVFGRQAVQRGYVVWCPYIYSFYSEEQQPAEGPAARGRDILQKKALLTGRTLMGLEIAKIRRGIDYLATLPEVDPKRIGCMDYRRAAITPFTQPRWRNGFRRLSSPDGSISGRAN